jgi:hypothetical protein
MIRKVKLKVLDTRSVDIEDDYALEFWTKELNVSGHKLKAAVQAAGTSVPDIKRELKKVN